MGCEMGRLLFSNPLALNLNAAALDRNPNGLRAEANGERHVEGRGDLCRAVLAPVMRNVSASSTVLNVKPFSNAHCMFSELANMKK